MWCCDYVWQRSQGVTIRQKISTWGQRSIADVRCGGVTGAQLWEVNWRVQGREHLWSDKISVSLGHVPFSLPHDLFVHAAHQARIYGYPPHQWPPLSKRLGGPEQCTFAVENKKKTVRDAKRFVVLFPLSFKKQSDTYSFFTRGKSAYWQSIFQLIHLLCIRLVQRTYIEHVIICTPATTESRHMHTGDIYVCVTLYL